MPVCHRRSSGLNQWEGEDNRGFLLESYAGELGPGDCIELTPREEFRAAIGNLALNGLGLRVCMPQAAEVAPDFTGYLVTYPLPSTFVAMMEARHKVMIDLQLPWLARHRFERGYKTAISPGGVLDFLVQVTVDSNPCESINSDGGEWGLRHQPWVEIRWWCKARQIDTLFKLIKSDHKEAK